jgi:methylmalonyl-CoA epimerase
MVHLAMLPASGSRLELIAPFSPDSPVARFLEKRGQGLHHIALSVPDLPALAARLRAQGVRLVDQLRRGAGGHWYVFVHPAAAGGVLLELIQREQEPIP